MQRSHGDLHGGGVGKSSGNPILVPETLKKICVCGEIFNPDILLKGGLENFEASCKRELMACTKCGYVHHKRCLKEYDEKCYNCKEDLSDNLKREMREIRKRDKKSSEKAANNAVQLQSVDINSNDDKQTITKPDVSDFQTRKATN